MVAICIWQYLRVFGKDVKYGYRYVVLMCWRDQWFFERCGSFKNSRCIALSINIKRYARHRGEPDVGRMDFVFACLNYRQPL